MHYLKDIWKPILVFFWLYVSTEISMFKPIGTKREVTLLNQSLYKNLKRTPIYYILSCRVILLRYVDFGIYLMVPFICIGPKKDWQIRAFNSSLKICHDCFQTYEETVPLCCQTWVGWNSMYLLVYVHLNIVCHEKLYGQAINKLTQIFPVNA